MDFKNNYGEAALAQCDKLISIALLEDMGEGDATSKALIPKGTTASFAFSARQSMVISSLFLIPRIYLQLSKLMNLMPAQITAHHDDGDTVHEGDNLITVTGDAHLLLTGERVALNFLQRSCGVSTLTRRYADALESNDCDLLDTRKTLPGYRYLDKYAVLCGGGKNHRLRLDDAILIKDNHLTIEQDIARAVSKARAAFPKLSVEVECDTIEQVGEALIAKADWILLDNMSLETMNLAVEIAKGTGTKLEASGGITLDRIGAISRCGVNAISVGALTHSATAVDIGLDRDIDAG